MNSRSKYAPAPAALLLGALLAFAGCLSTSRRAFAPGRLAPPYRVEAYQGGRRVEERAVAPGSANERAIAGWLAAHDTGWRPDLNSYAPGHRIKGERFDLNYFEGSRLCVLNYDEAGDGRWRQVSRTLDPSAASPPVFASDH
jgi:hypothetical protein